MAGFHTLRVQSTYNDRVSRVSILGIVVTVVGRYLLVDYLDPQGYLPSGQFWIGIWHYWWPYPGDPSMQRIPSLGLKVCKQYLHWALGIPRVVRNFQIVPSCSQTGGLVPKQRNLWNLCALSRAVKAQYLRSTSKSAHGCFNVL